MRDSVKGNGKNLQKVSEILVFLLYLKCAERVISPRLSSRFLQDSLSFSDRIQIFGFFHFIF